MHAESKISTQSVEQQTGYREKDVLPKDLDKKQLRDNGEMQVAEAKSVLKTVASCSFLGFVHWHSQLWLICLHL